MRPNECVSCVDFKCTDVNHSNYIVPYVEVKPQSIAIIMIAEAAPVSPNDYFYAPGNPLFAQTSVLAFNDAGAKVRSMNDILDMGVYLTTAVKCGKTGYGIKAKSIEICSHILEKELALFPNVKVIMLMGDAAIRSANYISKRLGEGRAIPAGPTYKTRCGKHFFRGMRAFPSYTHAGPSFFIEKSKRKMIAQDIGDALSIVAQSGS